MFTTRRAPGQAPTGTPITADVLEDALQAALAKREAGLRAELQAEFEAKIEQEVSLRGPGLRAKIKAEVESDFAKQRADCEDMIDSMVARGVAEGRRRFEQAHENELDALKSNLQAMATRAELAEQVCAALVIGILPTPGRTVAPGRFCRISAMPDLSAINQVLAGTTGDTITGIPVAKTEFPVVCGGQAFAGLSRREANKERPDSDFVVRV